MKVTSCLGALVVPVAWLAKVMLACDAETSVPMAVRLNSCGLSDRRP